MKIGRTLLREYPLLPLGTGTFAMHIDDNYLQPRPWASATDHLASGLVPLALLGAAARPAPQWFPTPHRHRS
jgi:hypothetical protein